MTFNYQVGKNNKLAMLQIVLAAPLNQYFKLREIKNIDEKVTQPMTTNPIILSHWCDSQLTSGNEEHEPDFTFSNILDQTKMYMHLLSLFIFIQTLKKVTDALYIYPPLQLTTFTFADTKSVLHSQLNNYSRIRLIAYWIIA